MAQQLVSQQAQTQMDAATQDQLSTSLILRNQKRKSKTLGIFDLVPGQPLSVKLQNIGLVVGLQYIVRLKSTLDPAVVTAINPQISNNKTFFNIIDRIQLIDVDGTSRHNATPFEIHTINSINARRTVSGYSERDSINQYDTIHKGAVLGGSLLTTTDAEVVFVQELPVCLYRQGDLRGIINLQTNLGDSYVTFTPASLASIFNTVANPRSTFKITGALSGVTLNHFSVEVVQHYYTADTYPLPSGAFQANPQLSAQYSYSIEGAVRSTDNMTSNGEKQVSFPNNRNIRNCLLSFTCDEILNGTKEDYVDVFSLTNQSLPTRVKFLVAGGNYFIDSSLTAYLADVQEGYGFDVGAGVIPMDFISSPASSDVYGSMQAVLVMNSNVTNPSLGVCFESHYLKGAALANVTQ